MEKLQPWTIKGKGYSERAKRIPPVAPSKPEQKFTEKYVQLSKKDPKNALILGATPELRDMAIKHGLDSYAVDLSMIMMKKYSALMKYKDNSKDIQKISNWLNMKFPDSFFNVIMGDISFSNLTTRKQADKLFKKLYKITLPNGFLVVRHIVNDNIKSRPLEKVVSLYRKGKISWNDFYVELRFLVFFKKLYDKKTFIFKTYKNYDLVEKAYKKGILTKKEANIVMHYKLKIVNLIHPEKEFIKLADKYGFKLVEIFRDKRYNFTNYIKMFAFQKI